MGDLTIICVIIFLSLSAVNSSFLGKSGAVNCIFRILSVCGRKHNNTLRLAIDILCTLVKSSKIENLFLIQNIWKSKKNTFKLTNFKLNSGAQRKNVNCCRIWACGLCIYYELVLYQLSFIAIIMYVGIFFWDDLPNKESRENHPHRDINTCM